MKKRRPRARHFQRRSAAAHRMPLCCRQATKAREGEGRGYYAQTQTAKIYAYDVERRCLARRVPDNSSRAMPGKTAL